MARKRRLKLICVTPITFSFPQNNQEYFSTNPNADRIKQAQGEIEQVKDVMVHNIGKYPSISLLVPVSRRKSVPYSYVYRL